MLFNPISVYLSSDDEALGKLGNIFSVNVTCLPTITRNYRHGCLSEMNITGTLPQAGNLKLFVPSLSTQSSTRPKQNIFNVVLMRPDKTE